MNARSATELYEDDFFAWTQLQAKELRRFARMRPNLPLDLGHIAEEIADLGENQRDSLRSWARRIVEYLLLIEHSPAQEPRRGWISEIVDLHSEIEGRLTPTLRRDLKRQLPHLYERAPRPDKQGRAIRRGRGRRSSARALSLHAGSGAGRLLARGSGRQDVLILNPDHP